MSNENGKIHPLIPKLVFVLILVAILFVAISLFDVVGRKQKAETEIDRLDKERAALADKKNELADLLDYFQDPRFIEKEARRRLNFQKPEEKVVVVSDEKDSSASFKSAIDSLTPSHIVNNKENQKQKGAFGNIFQWFYLIFKH